MKKLKGINPKDKLSVKKVPMEVVPPSVYAYLALSLNLGSNVKGYNPFNWREHKKPVRYSVYLSAIMRHLMLSMDGEDTDEESFGPHEASILANCAIILDAKLNNNLIDDRHKTGKITSLLKQIEKLTILQKKNYKKSLNK